MEKIYKVVEAFVSINGEGRKAGQLAVFVRFAGCNLNCSYCDTKWANTTDTKYTLMSADEIYELIKSAKVKNVTLTGGEPLLREGMTELLDILCSDEKLSIEIETNGSVDVSRFRIGKNPPSFTIDYKLGTSGMEEKMCMKNFSEVTEKDTVKFVSGSRNDLEKALEIMNTYKITEKASVYISPVFGMIEPAEIVEFMKENNLNDVNLQIQMHKVIWDPDKKGV